MKKSKSEEEQKNILVRVVRSFYKTSMTKKNVERAFNDEKSDFENIMDALYNKFSEEDGDVYVDSGDVNGTKIRVHKVQASKVEWDADMLKKVLGEYSDNVVMRKYDIVDFTLLISLAKKYKIPWNEFKKCIEYQDVVNEKALDNLSELGKVDKEEIKKCAKVKLNKPYYKLTEQ